MDYPILTGAISFAALLILLLTGIPVAIGLGLVSVVGYVLVVGDSGLAAYVPFNTLNSFVLTAVPLFILMGEVLLRCGISERLYRGTSRWVANIPGRAASLQCGELLIVRSHLRVQPGHGGHHRHHSLARLWKNGTTTGGSPWAPLQREELSASLIPPSISLIVYGSLAQTSVGRLFRRRGDPGNTAQSDVYGLHRL